MYWFVIYAARSRTRARVRAQHAGPPDCGSWFKCPAPAAQRGQPLARYTAILATAPPVIVAAAAAPRAQ